MNRLTIITAGSYLFGDLGQLRYFFEILVQATHDEGIILIGMTLLKDIPMHDTGTML